MRVFDFIQAVYVGVKHGIFNAESGSESVAQSALARIEDLMQRHAARHHMKRVRTTLPDGTITFVDELDHHHPAAAFDILGIRLVIGGEQATPQAVALQVLVAMGRVPTWCEFPVLRPLIEATNEWDLCRHMETL